MGHYTLKMAVPSSPTISGGLICCHACSHPSPTLVGHGALTTDAQPSSYVRLCKVKNSH